MVTRQLLSEVTTHGGTDHPPKDIYRPVVNEVVGIRVMVEPELKPVTQPGGEPVVNEMPEGKLFTLPLPEPMKDTFSELKVAVAVCGDAVVSVTDTVRGNVPHPVGVP